LYIGELQLYYDKCKDQPKRVAIKLGEVTYHKDQPKRIAIKLGEVISFGEGSRARVSSIHFSTHKKISKVSWLIEMNTIGLRSDLNVQKIV
jgi:hypothetical protein